jgi:hypothetical protein
VRAMMKPWPRPSACPKVTSLSFGAGRDMVSRLEREKKRARSDP